MPTEAEWLELQSQSLRHGTAVSRFGTGLAKRQSKKLRESLYGRITDQVAGALARVQSRGPLVGPQTRKGLRDGLANARGSLRDTLEEIERETRIELQDLAAEESDHETLLLLAIFGTGIAAASRSHLRRTVREASYAGETFSTHFRLFEFNLHAGLQREVTTGLASGESVTSILQRITGTRTTKGLIERASRSLETRIESLATGVAAAAREEVYKESPAVQHVMWIATLDGRTCPRCAALHGRRFPVGSGPRPPLHASCRCMTTPAGTSQSSVVAIDFGSWLKDQPVSVQNDVLGATRARLFREERIPLSRFVSGNRVLTLEELKARRFPNTPAVFR